MIFHEMYSVYYQTVAKILTHIIEEGATEKDLKEIVNQYAFGESALSILPSLKSGRWQLIHQDLTTPIRHIPSMPLTLLEKRWLKAISLDRRIRLFPVSFEGLEDVEPLFVDADYYIYDQYNDGDPFEDEGYIVRFRLILEAIRTKHPIKVEMRKRDGRTVYLKCIPLHLEYSQKDDKFRLITTGCKYISVINLSNILKCQLYHGEAIIPSEEKKAQMDTLTVEIYDERNALERVMLHFAHFEKHAECIGKRRYRLYVRYDVCDETELVIRILSFGPHVKVLGPERFVDAIKEKLKKQQICGLK